MKKILYSISAGLLIIVMAACNKTNIAGPDGYRTTTVPPAEGTLLKAEFTAYYPGSSARTKAAMAEKPALESLYLAVFSEDNGYLQNWIPAKFDAVTQAGVNTTAKYEVYLPLTTNEIFHVIANPPITQPTFDYENNFVKSMVTEGTEGAYWQRVEIKGGIKAKKNNQGEYILDGKGNYLIDETSLGGLNHVVLVRNYAKIVVKSADETQFKVTQYALGYFPTSGTVAPWNAKESGDNHTIGFDIPYVNIKNYLPQIQKEDAETDEDLHIQGKFYDDLTQKDNSGYKGYSGTMPEDVVFDENEPTTFVQASAADNGLYMYERTLPNETTQKPTVILMEVEWQDGNTLGITGGTKQWYKIELLDSEGEYMPVLRNVRYTLSLSGIKESGKGTATAAWNASALGNISSSLETAALNEISDGTSRLKVEKLDYVFFTDIGSTTLDFQFFPDESSTTPVNTTDAEKKVTVTVSRRAVDNYGHSVTNNVTEADVTVVPHDDGTSWGSIPLTIAPVSEVPEGGMLRSIIRVQGKYDTNRAIYREVMYTVMGQTDFTDKTSAQPAEGATDAMNQEVIVTIGLPSELSRDIFPLQVRIEAYDNNLSATDPKLPVLDGLSTFADKKAAGKRSFYYVKTIEFDEYREYDYTQSKYIYHTEHTAKLYTTKSSGNSTQIRLSYNNDDENTWLFKATTVDLDF